MAFTEGVSGNPRGRQSGSVSRAMFRALLEPELAQIVASLVSMAKAGDTQAACIIIDRLIPALKPTSDALTVKAGATLQETGAAII